VLEVTEYEPNFKNNGDTLGCASSVWHCEQKSFTHSEQSQLAPKSDILHLSSSTYKCNELLYNVKTYHKLPEMINNVSGGVFRFGG
jgi:hypothetical protein